MDSLNVLARATNYLSFNHSLKYLWDERLGLHFILYILMISETGLNEVFKQNQHEFLGVALLADFELIRNFVDQNDYR